MVVEIANDVIEYLEVNKRILNDQSDIIITLDELARQCYEHHHVIFAEIDVLEHLKNFELLEKRARRVFSTLFRKAFELKSFVDATKYRIRYTTAVDDNILKIEEDSAVLCVSILKKNILSQSILICENLRDCELYIDLIKEIIKEKRTNISISVHSIHCGGSEADATIKNEILTGECRPIACIMDSDKKSKTDKYGASAKNAIEIFNREKDKYPIALYVLSVRMKENLFPPDILTLETNIANKNFLTSLIPYKNDSHFEDFFRFFNFKDTVLVKDCEKISSFRTNLEEVGIVWPCGESDAMIRENILIQGIGPNGLENFRQNILKHRLDKKYEKMLQIPCSEESCEKVHETMIKTHKLLQCVQKPWLEDWKAIEQIVIDFGISFPEAMAFVG